MTNFGQNRKVQVVFNRILKTEVEQVLPFLHRLSEQQVLLEVLRTRMMEMFDQNYECHGIYFRDRLIGVFGLWFMTRHYAGRSCEPDHIFIEEEFRNKGIGEKLFEFIDAYALEKGCETSELNSYVSNYRSHKFYLNRGYEIKGYHFLKKL